MSTIASAIEIAWRRNAAYGERLVGDLTPAHFLAQPMASRMMNHPAWILSHLNLYGAIAVKLCRGEPFEDPAEHRFGRKSEPLGDPRKYDSKDSLIEAWRLIHANGTEALTAAADAAMSAPTPIERWRELHPTVGDMLVTLMVKHESAHLGQLSAWRRAMGLPRVAV